MTGYVVDTVACGGVGCTYGTVLGGAEGTRATGRAWETGTTVAAHATSAPMQPASTITLHRSIVMGVSLALQNPPRLDD
ncbi:MAG: hypothetical protein ABMA00_17030, partial [Gemmatimonas sp.]